MEEQAANAAASPASPPGNQKPAARANRQPKKCPGPDFYETVLEEAGKIELDNANSVDGLDGEIAILRIQIKALLKDDPENTELILKATGMVAKLVRTRYNITSAEKKGLKDAIYNVMKDIAVPLGIAALKK